MQIVLFRDNRRRREGRGEEGEEAGFQKGSCSDTGQSGEVSLLNLYHKLDESNDILKGGNLATIITVVRRGRMSSCGRDLSQPWRAEVS